MNTCLRVISDAYWCCMQNVIFPCCIILPDNDDNDLHDVNLLDNIYIPESMEEISVPMEEISVPMETETIDDEEASDILCETLVFESEDEEPIHITDNYYEFP